MRKLIQCVQNDNMNVSVKDTIYAIHNAGFDGVFLQWYNKDWEFSQEEQLKLCKSLGLTIEFCHLSYKGINNIWLKGIEGDNLTNQYLHDLDVLHDYGIDIVCMHLTSKTIAPQPNKIGLDRLKKIIEKAKSYNIKIAFENNRLEGYLEYIFDNLDYDNIGICFDSGHFHCHFKDKFNWDKFKNKIFIVHLHNNDQSFDMHLLPFDNIGNIDWLNLLTKLKCANYNGPIILESCYRHHYLEQSLNEFYLDSYIQARKLLQMFDKDEIILKGKLYLTSGGFLDGQRGEKSDKIIIDSCKNKKVLFVDNATLTGSNVAGIQNIITNLQKLNAKVKQISLSSENLKEIFKYNVVYITGGDFKPLIELANSSEIKKYFYQYLKQGKIIIGESAGSVIFGKDLKWLYDIKNGTKPKYDVILPTYKGLGLVDINFIPHWNKASVDLINKTLNYEKDNNLKITRVCDGEFLLFSF